MNQISGHGLRSDAVNSLAIWERGIWLAEAPAYFDAGRLSVNPRSDTMVIHQRPDFDKMDQTQLVIATFEGLRLIGEQIVTDMHSRGDTANRVLHLLQNGKLIAYGYLLPRNLTDGPVPIPRDLFQWRHIDWKTSAIRGAELEFVSIRILRSKWIESVTPKLAQFLPPALKAHRKRPGRPSSADVIVTAVQSLLAEGKLPNTKTRKEKVRVIRARVREQNPALFASDRGLAEETIAKYLAIELKRLQTHKL